MPMMMEDDLDDLFGEAPSPVLASNFPSGGLLQRIDDVRLNGCCQRTAWSKLGCIASIAEDGHGVILQALMCSPKDGQWKLSDPSERQGGSSMRSEHPLEHISWNHVGSELAAIDIFGRISIYSILIAMNRMVLLRSCAQDLEDDLGAIVGIMWLNPDRAMFRQAPATKAGSGWNHMSLQQKLPGPYNPTGRSALLAVTRSGSIRLLYHGHDNRWQEAKSEVGGISSFPEILTHAALCGEHDNANSILIATYNIEKQLQLHRLKIDFHQAPGKPHPYIPASLLTQHIGIVNSPLSTIQEDRDRRSGEASHPTSCPQLSFLDIVAFGNKNQDAEQVGPVILATFSSIPLQDQHGPVRSQPYSVMMQWELNQTHIGLHASFGHLTSKRSTSDSVTALPSESELRSLNHVTLEGIIVMAHLLNLGETLALAYSDARVEFRSAKTLNLVPNDEGLLKVSGLVELGFAFPSTKSYWQVAFSPETCALVAIDHGELLQLHVMQSPIAADQDSDLIPFDRVSTALITQLSKACRNGTNHDDLLAVMQRFLVEQTSFGLDRQAFVHRLLREMYRVLQVNTSHTLTASPDELLRLPHIQRCLSVQVSLGYSGEERHQTLSAKCAWTVLNVRMVSLSFAFAFKKPADANGESEMNKPEVLNAFQGMAAWSLDLMGYIVDELLRLEEWYLLDMHNSVDATTLNAKLHETNSPALSLVLISSSRSLLRYNCRGLRGISAQSKSHPSSESQFRVFCELQSIFQKRSVSADQFEHIISDVDREVSLAYTNAHVTDEGRQVTERDMLVSGEIPKILMSVVKSLFAKILQRTKLEVNVAELALADVSPLGLSDDRRSDAWRRVDAMDAHRKVKLPHGVQLRRCIRCCALMEDSLPYRGSSAWLSGMAKICFCGSLWILVGNWKDK